MLVGAVRMRERGRSDQQQHRTAAFHGRTVVSSA